MAAKFRSGYVGFANCREMRQEINKINGLINLFTFNANSSSQQLIHIDHNHLQSCYQRFDANDVQNHLPKSKPISNFNESQLLQSVILSSQRERIAIHYEITKNQHEDVEMFPYDFFWEQPLLNQIKIKSLNTPATDKIEFIKFVKENIYDLNKFVKESADAEQQLLEIGGYGPFCPYKELKLEAICDTGIGIVPKSLLAMPNGDVILATFSARKGYCFKSFSTDPFQRIDKKKGFVGSQELQNNPIGQSSTFGFF